MKFDVSDLLIVFDELLPLSDPENGSYWLKYTRRDSVSITLSFSAFEKMGTFSCEHDEITFASVAVDEFHSISVIDLDRRHVEIVCRGYGDGLLRCFIDFDGPIIFSIDLLNGSPDAD